MLGVHQAVGGQLLHGEGEAAQCERNAPMLRINVVMKTAALSKDLIHALAHTWRGVTLTISVTTEHQTYRVICSAPICNAVCQKWYFQFR